MPAWSKRIDRATTSPTSETSTPRTAAEPQRASFRGRAPASLHRSAHSSNPNQERGLGRGLMIVGGPYRSASSAVISHPRAQHRTLLSRPRTAPCEHCRTGATSAVHLSQRPPRRRSPTGCPRQHEANANAGRISNHCAFGALRRLAPGSRRSAPNVRSPTQAAGGPRACPVARRHLRPRSRPQAPSALREPPVSRSGSVSRRSPRRRDLTERITKRFPTARRCAKCARTRRRRTRVAPYGRSSGPSSPSIHPQPSKPTTGDRGLVRVFAALCS
jgi:hypothetical protein